MADPTVAPLRVLVVGGTGVFGERLVEGLLGTTDFDIVIAARNKARLVALIARGGGVPSRDGRVRLSVLPLDVSAVIPDDLRKADAFAVVDAAGPFQGASYRLARAAIEAGLHYIDLADARDFVAGFGALDAAARTAGVVALAGASSTPSLSNAVLDKMTAGWSRVRRVDVAISPGNRAPRGLAVVRSILSYAGRPVRVFDDGRWRERPGWAMTVHREMPGMGRRWLSLAETPDLDIVPARFDVLEAAIFRAGLELTMLHLGLWAASLPVRLGLSSSLAPLARAFRWMADRLKPFGTDRGGMTVDADGLDADGRRIRGSWSLVAEGGDGPFVPTLPALAVLRALADGRISVPGATACVGVPLEWIESEFEARRIVSRLSWERPSSLYQNVLEDEFLTLPAQIRRLHTPGWKARASGFARVDGAEGWIARLASAAFGLPRAADRAAVSVLIESGTGWERWTRDFGGRRFTSVLSNAPTPGRLVERFGAFSFELGLSVGREGVLGMPMLAWRFGPVPMPHPLGPVSLVTEDVDSEGRFQFDIELRLPLGLGRLVRYRGWLVPEPEDRRDADAAFAVLDPVSAPPLATRRLPARCTRHG